MSGLLRRYLRPHRLALLFVVFMLLVQALTNLYLPSLNADIINDGVVTGDISAIIRIGVIMLGVSAVLVIASVFTVYFAAKISMQVGRELRRDVFRKVDTLSLNQMHELGVPSLITRNTNDVQQVQMLVMTALTMMLLGPIMGIGAVIMAVQENPSLSLLLVVIVPLMLVVIGAFVVKMIPLFRVMQTKIDRVNQVLRENLTGIRVVRAFNRTSSEEARFASANADLTGAALKVTRLFALVFPLLMLIVNFSSVAVLWFGGHLVASGSMPIGNLTAFLQYIMLLLFSVMMAVMTMMMVPRASASAERIAQVLDTVPAIVDTATTESFTSPGLVEFEHVAFAYPGALDAILKDINLVMRPGTSTAIIGGTGSGKSTLINLIPRLLDVTAGSLRVGGVDVRDVPSELLWSRFGFVPQKAFLFSGTIGSNVRFGKPDASDDEVWRALELAQAAEFVRELPEQLASPVEQGGTNFSGGQRQRLSIARALVREPEILIFDDSFSALDYATDARLRHAIAEHVRDATVIIVAQRVSTIRHVDQIVVMEYGEIVGVGTHEELVASCETYRQIIDSQAEADAS